MPLATDMRHPLQCPKAAGSAVGMNCTHRIMAMQIINNRLVQLVTVEAHNDITTWPCTAFVTARNVRYYNKVTKAVMYPLKPKVGVGSINEADD